MSYYNEVYVKRVNRFGNDYQSRMQGQREFAFEQYLLSSVYRIDFDYNEHEYPATFEPYKQNETKVLHYLLTRTGVNIPGGTILWLPNKDQVKEPWMVYYLEETIASGYNRYIMLKMNQNITIYDKTNREKYQTWCYLYGQEDTNLKNTDKSSRLDILYNENLKSLYFIAPITDKIEKDDYFMVQIDNFDDLKEGFRVTGYDLHSTKGVEYVTVDPMYLKDMTPKILPEDIIQPKKLLKSAADHDNNDLPDGYFWIQSGE